MKTNRIFITLLFCVLSVNLVFAQNDDILGTWEGYWKNPNGHYYTFVFELKATGKNKVEGAFTWTLVKSPRDYEQPKLGLTAVEYVKGKYNARKRTLKLNGTGKDDPNSIIGIDKYELTLSKDKKVLQGKTENHGDWKGILYGERPKTELTNEPKITQTQKKKNEDILGIWEGEWSNEQGHYYTFVLELEETDAQKIKGAFTWKLIKSPRDYEQKKLGLTAKEFVEGEYDPETKKLSLTGTSKDDPHWIIGIDVYDLTLSKNKQILNGKTEHYGDWKGYFYGARTQLKQEQEVLLEDTTKLAGREIVTTDEFEVSQTELKIQVWDNKKVDGDIISLNLNGEWIVRNFTVVKEPKEFVLNLNKGINYLILHAENLGEIYPNTAAIKIFENGIEIKQLILNSNMGKSEAIKIIVP